MQNYLFKIKTTIYNIIETVISEIKSCSHRSTNDRSIIRELTNIEHLLLKRYSMLTKINQDSSQKKLIDYNLDFVNENIAEINDILKHDKHSYSNYLKVYQNSLDRLIGIIRSFNECCGEFLYNQDSMEFLKQSFKLTLKIKYFLKNKLCYSDKNLIDKIKIELEDKIKKEEEKKINISKQFNESLPCTNDDKVNKNSQARKQLAEQSIQGITRYLYDNKNNPFKKEKEEEETHKEEEKAKEKRRKEREKEEENKKRKEKEKKRHKEETKEKNNDIMLKKRYKESSDNYTDKEKKKYEKEKIRKEKTKEKNELNNEVTEITKQDIQNSKNKYTAIKQTNSILKDKISNKQQKELLKNITQIAKNAMSSIIEMSKTLSQDIKAIMEQSIEQLKNYNNDRFSSNKVLDFHNSEFIQEEECTENIGNESDYML
ncbi:MAG: hypothetical protein U1E31_00580 [Rickettsiales bacterium]